MTAQVLIEEAELNCAPLLLSFAPGLKMGISAAQYRRFIRAVREELQIAAVPVGLHLDHAFALDDIREALDLGFTSVMIDASRERWELNVERTREVVAMAHPIGVAVEAELGHVAIGGHYGNNEASQDQIGWLTEPQEATAFVTQTGVDALAVAIGTVHGVYNGEPKLDFERLAEISNSLSIPLVLHGASGTGADNLRRAVQLGIRKINVFSDLLKSLRAETLTGLQSDTNFDLFSSLRSAIAPVMDFYLDVSGSKDAIKGVPEAAARVKELFLEGYSCAQALFMTFAEVKGFASDVTMQTLDMYSGGYCNQGGPCGVLDGALAVIGAGCMPVNVLDKQARRQAWAVGEQYLLWYQAEIGELTAGN